MERWALLYRENDAMTRPRRWWGSKSRHEQTSIEIKSERFHLIFICITMKYEQFDAIFVWINHFPLFLFVINYTRFLYSPKKGSKQCLQHANFIQVEYHISKQVISISQKVHTPVRSRGFIQRYSQAVVSTPIATRFLIREIHLLSAEKFNFTFGILEPPVYSLCLHAFCTSKSCVFCIFLCNTDGDPFHFERLKEKLISWNIWCVCVCEYQQKYSIDSSTYLYFVLWFVNHGRCASLNAHLHLQQIT